MLEIAKICKKFLGTSELVLRGVSFKLSKGEALSLLGPSGCGKTTLLRIIAGLENADSGQILLGGQDLAAVPTQKRPFHLVFQKHALFPHLSVFENIAFGLRLKNVPDSDLRDRVQEVLEMVRLPDFAGRAPSTLSGGQAQRVALARALVNRPDVLLLDEPFSALDLKLRRELQAELRLLQKKLQLSLIFVTHDQEEAFVLSDRVILMNQGLIEQESSPREIYQAPQTAFTAEFVGSVSRLNVDRIHSVQNGRLDFESAGFKLKGKSFSADVLGQAAQAYIRPEAFHLKKNEKELITDNTIEVTIMDWFFRGSEVLLETQLGTRDLVWVAVQPHEWSEETYKRGAKVQLHFRSSETWIYPTQLESQPGEPGGGEALR
ncbi:MAG: ABC transporter ATP-binding protein [Bdellovibrio sp.]|jgi:spermidine/putrescine transport system ATP-binding protein